MRFFLILCISLLGSCHLRQVHQADIAMDLQGHRGCRGLKPENSIQAMLHAIDLGVSTLELDVVLSGDAQLVVSHEPFINRITCECPEGEEHRIWEMTLAEVQTFLCGGKRLKDFPEQTGRPEPKPSLIALVDSVIAHCETTGRTLPAFNIEIKSRPEWDQVMHPQPEVYVQTFLHQWKSLPDLTATIQSFDPRILKALHAMAPEIRLVYLTDKIMDSPKKAAETLGFVPAVYSPQYRLVTRRDARACRELEIELVVWTVNDPRQMRRMIRKGVDGIITDYPNRAIEVLEDVGMSW